MASTLSEVRTASQAKDYLSALEREEKQVTAELDILIEQQTQLDIKMASFQHMLPTLHALNTNASDLGSSIIQASLLAESVSSKVRVLDAAKTHVYSAMRQVDDVIDLKAWRPFKDDALLDVVTGVKSCVDGVQYSMNCGDYEKAASHIHRYLSLDQSFFQDATASPTPLQGGTSVGGTSANSFKLIKKSEGELKQLVRSKFQEAVELSDVVTAERFFRIYPLLNLQREGLGEFCSFLRKQVAASAQSSLGSAMDTCGKRAGLMFADVLTQLFEEIAGVIEKYYSTVESLYGESWTEVFIQKLQEECDAQVNKILKLLAEERSLENKVNTVAMALKSRTAIGAIRPDVLELDLLLTELSVCSSRCELYFRFIRRKLSKLSTVAQQEGHSHGNTGGAILSGCVTSLAMQELIGKYIVLENYFMSESLSKAVRMDNWCPGNLTSSMADDIFFVLQKCIRRALTSSNVDCTCAMLNHARTLLEEDYRTVLDSRLKTSLPVSTAGLDLSGLLQGRLQSLSTASADTEAKRPSCMVALNDVEVSIENIQKLTKEFEVETGKLVTQVGGSSADKLQSCLADLSSSVSKLKQLRQDGVAKLLEVVIMPGIKESLKEFSSQDHVLTEEKLASYEVNDPFVHQLVAKTQSTLDDVKTGFLEQLYQQVALEVVGAMATYLEQLVMKAAFNQLGGLQLDRDLRSLLGYLSSLTPWPVRDKFARLSQIATVLSLEKVGEVLDYWGDSAGPMVWRLTPAELRTVMGLRTEFNADEINSLKL